MQFTLIDFFIGFFLMNAMPHLIFGMLNMRFLSLFGFSAAGNVAYAIVNVIIATVLFHIQYGIRSITEHGIFIGAAAMLLIYLITVRFFNDLFKRTAPSHS